MADTGAQRAGGRVVARTLSDGAMTLGIDMPGTRKAYQALLAEELPLLLVKQMETTLGHEGSDGSWQTVVARAPG